MHSIIIIIIIIIIMQLGIIAIIKSISLEGIVTFFNCLSFSVNLGTLGYKSVLIRSLLTFIWHTLLGIWMMMLVCSDSIVTSIMKLKNEVGTGGPKSIDCRDNHVYYTSLCLLFLIIMCLLMVIHWCYP